MHINAYTLTTVPESSGLARLLGLQIDRDRQGEQKKAVSGEVMISLSACGRNKAGQ